MFTADGNADMLRDGQSFKATVMKGEGKMTYRLDRTVTPIALDLTATFANGKSNTMLFIIEFTNDDTMRMRMTPVGSPRAKDFKGAAPDEIIVLHRRVEK